ncbi:MAG: hypothetical protein N2C14_21345, partial [Planctomycetales bacterium]
HMSGDLADMDWEIQVGVTLKDGSELEVELKDRSGAASLAALQRRKRQVLVFPNDLPRSRLSRQRQTRLAKMLSYRAEDEEVHGVLAQGIAHGTLTHLEEVGYAKDQKNPSELTKVPTETIKHLTLTFQGIPVRERWQVQGGLGPVPNDPLYVTIATPNPTGPPKLQKASSASESAPASGS